MQYEVQKNRRDLDLKIVLNHKLTTLLDVLNSRCKKINMLLPLIPFMFFYLACHSVKDEYSNEQLYLLHQGESDNHLEDILIYVNNSTIKSDLDSSFMVKFKISEADFEVLRHYVIQKDTKRLDCYPCHRGTYQIDHFYKQKSRGYIVESEMGKHYFSEFISLMQSSKELQKFMEQHIIEQF